MGAHFSLSIFENVKISAFPADKLTIIGTFLRGDSIDDLESKAMSPWVLILGNEAHGISSNVQDYIHKKVVIPQLGSGDSLNVAVAGGIILHKLTNS
jgi:TrmH family RNA methyltransferase